jgi:hypothetical protein
MKTDSNETAPAMIAEFFIHVKKGTVGSVNSMVKLSKTNALGMNDVDCKDWLGLNEASTTRYNGNTAKTVPNKPTR